MKLIDLEAHFITPEFAEFVHGTGSVPATGGRKSTQQSRRAAPTSNQDLLLDIEGERLRDMDKDGVDMQVLSLINPHIQMLEPSEAIMWGRRLNDDLSAICKTHPDRFIGLAAIPVQSPAEAAKELERAVKDLGLKGVCIKSHARNEYLDAKKYWVIFETAEKLDVPIYLHPSNPSTALLSAFDGYRPLSSAALGFATDLSVHVMRLICSGLFDKYPRLKIILGHMGEGLPYWLPRLDYGWSNQAKAEGRTLAKELSEYLKTNFTITTSGMFFFPAFICCYLGLGADKMAFATDYPMVKYGKAVEFMKELPICDSDKEKIYHLNAERLFKL